jgi:hypothetical protein
MFFSICMDGEKGYSPVGEPAEGLRSPPSPSNSPSPVSFCAIRQSRIGDLRGTVGASDLAERPGPGTGDAGKRILARQDLHPDTCPRISQPPGKRFHEQSTLLVNAPTLRAGASFRCLADIRAHCAKPVRGRWCARKWRSCRLATPSDRRLARGRRARATRRHIEQCRTSAPTHLCRVLARAYATSKPGAPQEPPNISSLCRDERQPAPAIAFCRQDLRFADRYLAGRTLRLGILTRCIGAPEIVSGGPRGAIGHPQPGGRGSTPTIHPRIRTRSSIST